MGKTPPPQLKAWMEHVKEVRRANKSMKYKDVLKKARKTFKKQKSSSKSERSKSLHIHVHTRKNKSKRKSKKLKKSKRKKRRTKRRFKGGQLTNGHNMTEEEKKKWKENVLNNR